MPIYKPSELHQFLTSLGIHPKKALSQNFLIDGNILRKIVAASKVQAGDVVMEIGPGPGSLTEMLLDAGAHVIAVEKDTVLANALERLKSPERHLDVFCEDVMKFDLRQHVKPGQKVKVIANLPYHLTTPIIGMLITQHDLFSSLTLMVQDEVGRRFVGKPGTSEYSSFTVFLNFYSNPHYAFTVSRNCFYPPPKVDSAVVTLELKTPPNVSDEAKFFEMTRTAFEHRRKMLRGSLRDLYTSEKVTEALNEIGCNPEARPENLSLDQFLALFKTLN